MEEPGETWLGPVSVLHGGRWCEGWAVEPLVREEAGSPGAELRMKLKAGFSGFGSLIAGEDGLKDRKRG